MQLLSCFHHYSLCFCYFSLSNISYINTNRYTWFPLPRDCMRPDRIGECACLFRPAPLLGAMGCTIGMSSTERSDVSLTVTLQSLTWNSTYCGIHSWSFAWNILPARATTTIVIQSSKSPYSEILMHQINSLLPTRSILPDYGALIITGQISKSKYWEFNSRG